MIQEAILFNKDNVGVIMENINDYPTAEELLEDYQWMLDMHTTLVLCRDILDDGWASVSYVVHSSVFKANWPDIQLNDKTFVEVRRF